MRHNIKPLTAADAVPFSEKSEAPLPLYRAIPDPDPFPVDALGSVMADAVRAIEDKTQAPTEIAAQSILAVGALAAQAQVNVCLPTGQIRPVSCFFMTVAESGERKSTVDSLALLGVRKRQENLSADHVDVMADYHNKRDAWEAQRKQILSPRTGKGETTQDAKAKALAALGPEPARPMDPVLICGSPTIEGLQKLFLAGHPSLGLFSGEGGQFINGHSMSAEKKIGTAATISDLWDLGEIERIRSGDGVSKERGRRLSVHLMCQPDVASLMLSDRALADQGLLSRFLVAAPKSRIGTRLWREPDPASDDAVNRFHERVLNLLERPYPVADGRLRELTPRELHLSAEAKAKWKAFADHNERLMAPRGVLTPIRGLANKLAEHAARIAAILTLFKTSDAVEVTADATDAGIRIAQYYAGEALRLFHAGQTDLDLILANTLLEWMREKYPSEPVALRTIYQVGPNAVRVAQRARVIAGILEAHRHIESVSGAVIDGVKCKEAWRLRRV